MAQSIQLKRGQSRNLIPTNLKDGEIIFCLDDNTLRVKNNNGNMAKFQPINFEQNSDTPNVLIGSVSAITKRCESYYTKIGNHVSVMFDIIFGDNSGKNGDVTMSLPFTQSLSYVRGSAVIGICNIEVPDKKVSGVVWQNKVSFLLDGDLNNTLKALHLTNGSQITGRYEFVAE